VASPFVLVRPQQAINLDEPELDMELFDSPVNPSMPVETPSKTYIAIIKSGALIEKVGRGEASQSIPRRAVRAVPPRACA